MLNKERILLIGGTGYIGSPLSKALSEDLGVWAPPIEEVNLFVPKTISEYINWLQPKVIVHAGGIWDRKMVEADPTTAIAMYRDSSKLLADWSRDDYWHDLYLISSGDVFEGVNRFSGPHSEGSHPIARSHFSATRLFLETTMGSMANVIRVGVPYDSTPGNFITNMIDVMLDPTRADECSFATNRRLTPIFLPDAVDAIAQLITSFRTSKWHVTTKEVWSELLVAKTIHNYLTENYKGYINPLLHYSLQMDVDISLTTSKVLGRPTPRGLVDILNEVIFGYLILREHNMAHA